MSDSDTTAVTSTPQPTAPSAPATPTPAKPADESTTLNVHACEICEQAVIDDDPCAFCGFKPADE